MGEKDATAQATPKLGLDMVQDHSTCSKAEFQRPMSQQNHVEELGFRKILEMPIDTNSKLRQL